MKGLGLAWLISVYKLEGWLFFSGASHLALEVEVCFFFLEGWWWSVTPLWPKLRRGLVFRRYLY